MHEDRPSHAYLVGKDMTEMICEVDRERIEALARQLEDAASALIEHAAQLRLLSDPPPDPPPDPPWRKRKDASEEVDGESEAGTSGVRRRWVEDTVQRRRGPISRSDTHPTSEQKEAAAKVLLEELPNVGDRLHVEAHFGETGPDRKAALWVALVDKRFETVEMVDRMMIERVKA